MTTHQSKIDQLISELCPNGVEFKEVGKVCRVSRGRVMSKDYLSANAGEYPVYSSQTLNHGVFGKINTFDYDGEYVTWTTDGANAGSVFYRNGKFSITNVCGLLKPNDETNLNVKFLAYILGTIAKSYVNAGMGNPKIMSNVMAGIKIPIPPLPIQEEIVDILDKFTQLEAELEAELEARKKQYEYYRDEMLSFGDEAEWSTLGNISLRTSSGGTPRAGSSVYYDNGTIPWLRTNEVKFNEIFETAVLITEEAVKKTSAKWIPKNCVIVAISGATAGRSAINKIPMTTNQHCCNLEIDPEKANYKYVFYWVASNYEKLKSLGRGARADLNSAIIKGFSIPIPSIEEQEEIANTLDKFDSLVNDISIGLPAEINARRKQYEYYRGKLLTFKPLQK